MAVCARSGLLLQRAFGQSFSPKSSLEAWWGLDLERSGLQSVRGEAGVPAGSPEAHVRVCPPKRGQPLARRGGAGAAGPGPRRGRPHCIRSGCSCGAWYCTKAAPAGAVADSA